MSATLDLSLIPPLGEPRPQPVPAATETTLANGLRVVVVPRPGVPLIELRLRVPFAASSAGCRRGCTPRAASVLSGAVLLGTASHDQTGIAQLLQGHGAEMSVSSDSDRLLFGTTLLPGGLRPVLGVLAELLTSATYPADGVEGERDRLAERITIALSQPSVLARAALNARRYAGHPYAISLPDPALVAGVTGDDACAAARRAGAARRQHASCWSASSTRRPPPTPSPRRWPAGPPRGTAEESAPATALHVAGPRARRPARRRAVQHPARRSRAHPHRPRPGRGPAGRDGLRRLLLLPAGREHPGAARLQLQPAQLRGAPGRVRRPSSSRPTSPRR